MFRYKPAPDKNLVHISFYADNGKLRSEHIPRETNLLILKLRWKFMRLLGRYGIPVYYWDIRFALPGSTRKAEDLRFLDHVYDVHHGNPQSWRELRHFLRAAKLYDLEYHRLAKHIFQSERDKSAITHPYAKAYIKMWKLDRDPQWKMMYHGVNGMDYADMLGIMIDGWEKEINRSKRRIRYAEKKLRTKI